MQPRALIIAGPGTNRDNDLAFAFASAGASTRIAYIDEIADDPDLIADSQLLGIAGGFSYGDALGAGRMMALELMSKVGDSIQAFVDSGRPVIGICNGFQVLTRARLLPGSLGHNAQGRFDCRWVTIEIDTDSRSLWTAGIDEPIHCPIAHGEGRYVHPDTTNLDAAGQVAFRYRSTNPNGSMEDIAGVTNAAGNVLGLMPHPENSVLPRQHPYRRRSGQRSVNDGEELNVENLGLRLFRNGVATAAEM